MNDENNSTLPVQINEQVIIPTTVDVPEKQVVLITEVQVKNDTTATIALSVVGSFLFLVLMSICMCWVVVSADIKINQQFRSIIKHRMLALIINLDRALTTSHMQTSRSLMLALMLATDTYCKNHTLKVATSLKRVSTRPKSHPVSLLSSMNRRPTRTL